MNFNKQKNGYNEKEVDEYITSINLTHQKELKEKDEIILKLKNEINKVKEKEQSINLALTAAVEKAKEIEKSSQDIYKLKIEKLSMLYSKWEILLNEMIKKHPDLKDVSNIRDKIGKLKNSIKETIKGDFEIDFIEKIPSDPIKNLLSKITEKKNEQKSKQQVKTIARKNKINPELKTDLEILEEKSNLIKPISNIKLNKDEKYENVVDKFLSNEYDISDNFNSFLKNKEEESSKFDINEAINPKEDLKEIMKSFDFYNNEN